MQPARGAPLPLTYVTCVNCSSDGDFRAVASRVDVWALGVLLYECLVGTPPFEVPDSVEDTHTCIKERAVHFPSEPALSDEAKDFVLRLLNKDPDKRPAGRLTAAPAQRASAIRRGLSTAVQLRQYELCDKCYPTFQTSSQKPQECNKPLPYTQSPFLPRRLARPRPRCGGRAASGRRAPG